MSIISEMKALIETCPYLEDFTLRVDYHDDDIEGYGVFPAGTDTLYSDMDGNTALQSRFVLQANRYTASDVMRLDNCDFVENFQNWLNGFNRKGLALKAGDFVSISCGGGYFEDFNEDSKCGVYKIPCSITYEREG